jgi:transposase-like protein
MKSRRKFSSAFKAKVALEAIRERESLSSLSSRYQLKSEQISKWKKEFLGKSELVFEQEFPEQRAEKEVQKLKEIIGDLTVQIEFLKKKL